MAKRHVLRNAGRTSRRVRAAVIGSMAALWLIMGVGCQAFKGTEESAEVPDFTVRQDMGPKKAELWDEEPLIVDEVLPEGEPGLERRTELPERRGGEDVERPVSQYPENLIKGIVDPEEAVEVKLNFDAMQMTELVEAFAHLLQFSYLIDPAIASKGAVSINVDSEMTAREAWQTFEHILWLSGAYASRNPGFIHIMPFDKMPKERRLLFNHDTMANVEVALVPIRYRKSADIVGIIEPFTTDGATVKDLTDSNTLLMVEAPANMPKLRELINQLDQKGEAGWPHICLPVRNVDAEEIVEELNSLLPVLGFPVTNTSPSGGAIKLAALPRLQCVVASAAMTDVLDEVERWIQVLDTSDNLEKENLYWYNVKHSTADQLKEALETFFTTEATTATRPSRTKSTSSKASATTGSTDQPAAARTPTRSTSSSSSRTGEEEGLNGTIFDTPVVVLVDEVRERLTIKTTQRAYALIKALLTRQDVAPRQVSIRAMIAEITRNETTEYGFSYAAKRLVDHGGDTLGLISAGAGNIPTDITAADFALLFRDRKGDPLAFMKAVAGETNIKILSEPQILALSGESATINVGQRVPIPTEQASYGGDLDNFRTNYEYEETGVLMSVTPFVTAGNDVRIEVSQEVSDAADSSDPTIPPRISNKNLESVLNIPDGSTVMLGGLIRTRTSNSHTGWPILKDIPGVGVIFRTNSSSDDRSELLVLLTVNVIENESQIEHLVRKYHAALNEINAQRRREARGDE